MGTWPIYKKHFLQLILTKKNKKKLSFDKISPRDFHFLLFFSICTCVIKVQVLPIPLTLQDPNSFSRLKRAWCSFARSHRGAVRVIVSLRRRKRRATRSFCIVTSWLMRCRWNINLVYIKIHYCHGVRFLNDFFIRYMLLMLLTHLLASSVDAFHQHKLNLPGCWWIVCMCSEPWFSINCRLTCIKNPIVEIRWS